MRVEIRCRGMMSIEEMREFVVSAEPFEFKGATREEKYRWIEETLNRQKYLKLTKREKGIVRAYMRKMTGFSTSHLTRLISGYRWTGKVTVTSYRRHRFPRRYTPEDIRLLAEVDELNERLSGPATKKILERQYELFGKEEYARVKEISVSHLYNLRKSRSYLRQTTFFQKTKPTSVNIGERRRPDPQGRPGYLRVDTVHQGDKNGTKGVYHLNTIDEVTQWQVLGCTEKISERYLKPVLIALLDQYPFRIRGFHADNGSEYINKVVAALLNKLLIELTKSRARKTNDNALVEGKNGSIVRKYMGYGYIPQKMAERINGFYREYFTPYLNYHRPCGYATLTVDKKGKEKKKYDTYMTPHEKLSSLPKAREYLKPGVTLANLDEIAYKYSDVEFASMMQREKRKLFQEITQRPKVKTTQPQEALSCSSFD
jgi:transposase InsO family protein